MRWNKTYRNLNKTYQYKRSSSALHKVWKNELALKIRSKDIWDTYILPLIWYINCVRSEDICLFLHDTYTAVCKKWRHIRRNLTAAAMAPILNAWETGPRGILGLSINDYHVTIIIWKRGFKMSTILGFLSGMITTYKTLLVGLFNI